MDIDRQLAVSTTKNLYKYWKMLIYGQIRPLKCSYFDIFDEFLTKQPKLKKNCITLLLRTHHGLSNSLKILTVSGKHSCYLYLLHGLSALIPTIFPLIHLVSRFLTPAGYTHLRAFSLLDIVRLTPSLFVSLCSYYHLN